MKAATENGRAVADHASSSIAPEVVEGFEADLREKDDEIRRLRERLALFDDLHPELRRLEERLSHETAERERLWRTLYGYDEDAEQGGSGLAGWTFARDFGRPDAAPPEWLVQGLVSERQKLVISGQAKAHKTSFVLELGVALASGTPFLGRFPVPRPRRVGLLMLEDDKHSIEQRIERLCWAHGTTPEDIGDMLAYERPWSFVLSEEAVEDLGRRAKADKLDVLLIDNWAQVHLDNPNVEHEVRPQLRRLSALQAQVPGLTVGLAAHANQNASPRQRVVQNIRGSTALADWPDAIVELFHRREQHLVHVRVTARNIPPRPDFSFAVEDEHPADGWNSEPSGYLRLRMLDQADAEQGRDELAAVILAALEEAGELNASGIRQAVRDSPVTAKGIAVDAERKRLVAAGRIKEQRVGGSRGNIYTLVSEKEED